jgi:hypothetical protein
MRQQGSTATTVVPAEGREASQRPTGFPSGTPWDIWDIAHFRDGKTRRIEPGLECLVDGFPFRLADGRTGEGQSRAALLKGFGNAINPYTAAAFVLSFLETEI